MKEKVLPKLLVSREEADKKIQGQIGKAKELRYRDIGSISGLRKALTDYQEWDEYNKYLLLGLFNTPSIADRYVNFSNSTPIASIASSLPSEKDKFLDDYISYVVGMDRHINHLNGIYERLELFPELVVNTSPSTSNSKIFIVHGRDDTTKNTVASFVSNLDFEVIILERLPNEGLTMIEKFEKHAGTADFAIVLFTPDDVGALKDKVEEESEPRVRQNVILEHGYFMGKLGRERVCVIHKGKIEWPSDIHGLVYVPMDDNNEWQKKLIMEMKAAGLLVHNDTSETLPLHSKETPVPTLNFKGKQFVYAYHRIVPFRTLTIDTGKSFANEKLPSLDDNLIVHGDNLHALKALFPKYSGKIKCIYIDPPYNTGSENWVYSDNINSSLMQTWLGENVPINIGDLERSNRWLCMMWPRLLLLRELLSDDGVIFISIDDSEQHHLRMLMNEIFGETNFIESLIWHSRSGRGATAKNTATLHQYVVVYAKDKDLVKFRADRRVRETESKVSLRRSGQADRREDRPTMYYPIHSDEFGEIYPIRPDATEGCWKVSQSKMKDLIENDLVVFEKRRDGRIEAYRIIPAGTESYTTYPSLLDSGIVKTTMHGSIELKEVLGSNKFSYPKPSSLIKELISLCTQKEDIILDSFAGSGTTAHAVLALNKEDGGNRKFILVECEDYADIITAERVRRVINGVENAKDENLRVGLSSSFTYCTLGELIDEEGMRTGEFFPPTRP